MGGGGGGYMPPATADLARKIREQRSEERARQLDGDVNKLLRSVLGTYERDAETTKEHLEELESVLAEVADIEGFLLGGSVAKHTFVDGLSDIDALVILKSQYCRGKSPRQILKHFFTSLRERLSSAHVESIHEGDLAVTVRFRGGYEVQLLPALRRRGKLAIRNPGGYGWLAIEPGKFHQALTRQNKRLGGVLVPTIKLVKSICSDFPASCRPTGYHIESMCLKAAGDFKGALTPKALLPYMLSRSSELVRAPIRDITGQSRSVDSGLGAANSPARQAASRALSAVAERLEHAATIDAWIDVAVGT